MKSICVYCGSSSGTKPYYAEAARVLAKEMVDQHIALVYGGGKIGLMGAIADEVMRLGGEATGVIPKALMEKEVGHKGLTRLHIVKDMHERKATMAELAEGFIAMPGGIGTLEELFEVFTWSRLGFHDKPIGMLNTQGFYDGLISFLRHLVTEDFLSKDQEALLLHASEPKTLLAQFHTYSANRHNKLLPPSTAKEILP
jgi:uncharacterized protein (TIGR00730 family)